jgi:rare lipoprotein A
MNKLLLAIVVAASFIPFAAGAASWMGKASYYSGYKSRTASGARFNPNGMTAAHRTLAFGTAVRVTNLENGRSAVVLVNDRGPFVAGRVIDVSLRAAEVLSFRKKGTATVRVETTGE